MIIVIFLYLYIRALLGFYSYDFYYNIQATIYKDWIPKSVALSEIKNGHNKGGRMRDLNALRTLWRVNLL